MRLMRRLGIVMLLVLACTSCDRTLVLVLPTPPSPVVQVKGPGHPIRCGDVRTLLDAGRICQCEQIADDVIACRADVPLVPEQPAAR